MKTKNEKLANDLGDKLLGHLVGGTRLRAGLAASLTRELESQATATKQKRLAKAPSPADCATWDALFEDAKTVLASIKRLSRTE